MSINSLKNIKADIEKNVGNKVALKANDGRRRVFVNKGVIQETYNSIFVIELDGDYSRKVTYSYSDVLTKTVQLVYI